MTEITRDTEITVSFVDVDRRAFTPGGLQRAEWQRGHDAGALREAADDSAGDYVSLGAEYANADFWRWIIGEARGDTSFVWLQAGDSRAKLTVQEWWEVSHALAAYKAMFRGDRPLYSRVVAGADDAAAVVRAHQYGEG